LVFETYQCLRRLGLSIDIISPQSEDLDQYKLVLAPGLMTLSEQHKLALQNTSATVIWGPRTAAKQEVMRIPNTLAPNINGVNLKVTHCESIRPDRPVSLRNGGHLKLYREHIESDLEVIATANDGVPVLLQQDHFYYLAAWLDMDALTPIIEQRCQALGIDTLSMPHGVRRRQTGNECFWFNYGAQPQTIDDITLPAAGVVRQT
jgi:beta-galactosidase